MIAIIFRRIRRKTHKGGKSCVHDACPLIAPVIYILTRDYPTLDFLLQYYMHGKKHVIVRKDNGMTAKLVVSKTSHVINVNIEEDFDYEFDFSADLIALFSI